MKKTFSAFVAVATIAGSLVATPASAQRGVAAGVAAGLIGGAIVGGAIAASRPARLWQPGAGVCGRPALPLGSRALLGWLRLALPPRSVLRLIAADAQSSAPRFQNPADASAGFFFFCLICALVWPVCLRRAVFSAPR